MTGHLSRLARSVLSGLTTFGMAFSGAHPSLLAPGEAPDDVEPVADAAGERLDEQEVGA